MSIDRALTVLARIDKDTFSTRDYSGAYMAETGRNIRPWDIADDIRSAVSAGVIEMIGFDKFRDCRSAGR